MENIYISCPKPRKGGVMQSKQDKELSAKSDDGSGGAKTSLDYFSRIKKGTNAYSAYEQALDAIKAIPRVNGFACDIPDFFEVDRDDLPTIRQSYDEAVVIVEKRANAVITNIELLKNMIIDSYAQGSDNQSKVKSELSGYCPSLGSLMARIPPFKVIKTADLGATPNDEVDRMLVESSLASSTDLINRVFGALVAKVKASQGMGGKDTRKRSQAQNIEQEYERAMKKVADFASHPDLVADLDKAVKAVSQIPMDNDSLATEDGQAKVKGVLDILCPQPAQTEQAKPVLTSKPAEVEEGGEDNPFLSEDACDKLVASVAKQPVEEEEEELDEEEQALNTPMTLEAMPEEAVTFEAETGDTLVNTDVEAVETEEDYDEENPFM